MSIPATEWRNKNNVRGMKNLYQAPIGQIISSVQVTILLKHSALKLSSIYVFMFVLLDVKTSQGVFRRNQTLYSQRVKELRI